MSAEHGREPKKEPAQNRPPRKKVGEPTANPLPDGDYSIPQPPGDDNPSNPAS